MIERAKAFLSSMLNPSPSPSPPSTSGPSASGETAAMEGAGLLEEKHQPPQQSSSSSSSSSYTYWVRQSSLDAAPMPVPRKLSAEDLSKCSRPPSSSPALGSVWNQVDSSPSASLFYIRCRSRRRLASDSDIRQRILMFRDISRAKIESFFVNLRIPTIEKSSCSRSYYLLHSKISPFDSTTLNVDHVKSVRAFRTPRLLDLAGTWEEKNLNTWANNRIKELITSLDSMDFSNGRASIREVSKCVGDAFLVTVRNKKRVGYTCELTLRFRGEWFIQEENKKIKGYIDVPEFTFGELDELQIEVRLSEDKDLTADDKRRVATDIKGFLPAIRERLLAFEQELKDR